VLVLDDALIKRRRAHERAILSALDSTRPARTRIVIAHRI